MPLYSELPTNINTVDIIIAGGGTAACVLASRLSDADPSLSILVIEAGSNNHGDPTIVTPLLFLFHGAPGSKTMTLHKGKKSEFLSNRELVIPVAHILGGGSSVNFLVYSRAQRSDYDSWHAPGWSSGELLPYMKKTETYHGDDPKDIHGHDGPVQITRGTYTSLRSENAFVAAAEKLGWKEYEDLSDLVSNNGVQRAKRYISADGKRQDAAHSYLHPRLQDDKHPNLHVVVDSQVIRVLFEGKKASGVTYQPKEGASRTIKARKTVVLSCGTCGTPPVLERSGIGKLEVLERAGIAPVSEVPGVGEGYEDHHSVSCAFKSSLEPDETIDGLVNGTLDVPSMLEKGDKMLGWNCLDVSCKLRPTQSDIATLGADFQRIWNQNFEDDLSKPLTMMSLGNGYPNDPSEVPRGQYFTISAFSIYPLSRGSMHITGPELSDPVDFDPGFFSDAEGFDVKTCRWAYKKQRELARRMSTYRGEATPCHPPFPADSEARCIETDGPLAPDITDIKYTAEDDTVIDQWLREKVASTWHSLGTCKMLPLEKNGVVDANLNVHGVTGLKIADMSISPTNLAGHTNHTAMVIGEKAADIIVKELGRI